MVLILDLRRLKAVGIDRLTLDLLLPLLPSSVDRYSHGIAACIPSTRDESEVNVGVIRLLRMPEELGFLPQELSVLEGVTSYLGI